MAASVAQPKLTSEEVESRLRQQLASDRASGRIVSCDDNLLDIVARDTVQDLWPGSRIKTYLPVLVLRRARDEIQATAGLR